MPKCPQCKKEISHLDYEGKHVIGASLIVGGKYTNKYEKNVVDLIYTCPLCGKQLFINEDRALKFMQ